MLKLLKPWLQTNLRWLSYQSSLENTGTERKAELNQAISLLVTDEPTDTNTMSSVSIDDDYELGFTPTLNLKCLIAPYCQYKSMLIAPLDGALIESYVDHQEKQLNQYEWDRELSDELLRKL